MNPEAERTARAELLAGIRSGNAVRPGAAWLQLANIEESRSHLRRALRAFRRAFDVGPDDVRQVALEGVQRVGGALLAAGKFLLRAEDEAQLTMLVERDDEPWAETAPSLAGAAERAQGLRNRLAQSGAPAGLLAALDGVAACGRANALLPAYSDRSLALELEAHAGVDPKLGPLAAKWRQATLAWYSWLVQQEEPNEEPRSQVARARALAREGRWDEAIDVVAALSRDPAFDAPRWAFLADELGDQAARATAVGAATRLHQLALDGYEQYASWATSGGEGMARMGDVNRLLAKLGRPQR